MNTQMSPKTRQEVLMEMRRRYVRAGRRYRAQRLNELVQLFGYHRKAAVRALQPKPAAVAAPFARGRPREYDPDKLLPPLKAIAGLGRELRLSDSDLTQAVIDNHLASIVGRDL